MSETYDRNGERRAYMLDVSMLILNLLDIERIAQQPASVTHLAVPSALVTMIWAARDGSPVLYDFIHAYLVALQRNEAHHSSSDERIRQFVDVDDDKLREIAGQVVAKVTRTWAPLMQGATRSTDGYSNTPYGPHGTATSRGNRPIQRYELVRSVTPKQLATLRRAYARKLKLPVHPLYDAYFLQVYHAENVGRTATSDPCHLIALGRSTHEVITGWISKSRLPTATSFESDPYTNDLGEFVRAYVRPEWWSTTFGLGLDLTLSAFIDLELARVLAITNLAGATVLHATVKTPEITALNGILLASIAVLVITMIAVLAFRPSWLFDRATNPPPATNIASFTIEDEETPPNDATPTIPAPTPTEPVDAADQSAETQPPLPASTPPPLDPNVCLYVVQPGDTLASIAARYRIPVDSLYAANELLGRGVFRVRQRLRVDAPCCRPVGDAGTAYYVMPQETLYSIARRHSTTVDAVARANNLADPSYIQAHQMLCIPSN